jgi:hypothetical protein
MSRRSRIIRNEDVPPMTLQDAIGNAEDDLRLQWMIEKAHGEMFTDDDLHETMLVEDLITRYWNGDRSLRNEFKVWLKMQGVNSSTEET